MSAFQSLSFVPKSVIFFREFEISIQRYQWFLSELPEMLCESEMEVEQHTCWSGEDVVERYIGCIVSFVLSISHYV